MLSEEWMPQGRNHEGVTMSYSDNTLPKETFR